MRDGEQTVGVVLDPEQKLEIARLLDELGVDRIEAGFPRVSDDDWRAVELIAAAGLRAEIWGFSRAVPADLEALVELGVRFSVIESPISDLKLDAIGVSREKMLDRITSAMRFAAEHGIHAAFFGVDSSRAAPDFYERGLLGGGRGRREGSRRRRHARDRLARGGRGARRRTPSSSSTCPCTSTATTTSASRPRAPLPRYVPARRYVHGTINGMGERAGNANLGEVALTLRALYGVESNLRLDRIRDVSARVRELSGYELEPWKPVTGETLYRRESGAVASQFHDPQSIEPYSSELVATERSIVLGKKSGLDSIRIKAEELGSTCPRSGARRCSPPSRKLGMEKRGLVTDEEFRALVG